MCQQLRVSLYKWISRDAIDKFYQLKFHQMKFHQMKGIKERTHNQLFIC